MNNKDLGLIEYLILEDFCALYYGGFLITKKNAKFGGIDISIHIPYNYQKVIKDKYIITDREINV